MSNIANYDDPLALFREWFGAAKAEKSIIEPTAMTLATANAEGRPAARIVLLKHWDEQGFVWFTNLESPKSEDLKENPRAALCFYWMPLERQVRIEGRVQQINDGLADAYYNSRPRGSQIGAWSSIQSRPLDSRETLENRVKEFTQKYEGSVIPRPPHWSGWQLIPERMEFWQQREFRLHDRFIFAFENGAWQRQRLYP